MYVRFQLDPSIISDLRTSLSQNIPHMIALSKLENDGVFDPVKFVLDSAVGALAAALFSTYGQFPFILATRTYVLNES